MFIWPKLILDGLLILTWCKLELLLVRFEGQFCIGKEVFLVQATPWKFMETFSFSLLQFLVSEDFGDRLGLLKCSEDSQNFRNL